MTRRRAGILLHPSTLPGRFGIGDLGPEAERFLAWAQAGGQSVWQLLPLGPTAHGDSPYPCLSAFADNTDLISPERLVEDGLLPLADLEDVAGGSVRFRENDTVSSWSSTGHFTFFLMGFSGASGELFAFKTRAGE